MTVDSNRRAIVVGGGIGGLSTAIALQRVGIEATIFERAPELGEIGAGLGLQTNAFKALDRMGLAEAILPVSPETETYEFRRSTGELIAIIPQGELGRKLGAPSVCIHRADLQTALLGALDPQVIQLGATCVGFEQDDTGVTAFFSDGREERGAVLIGADGINSVVRKQLLGDSKPRYAGYAVWRGVATFAHEAFPVGVARQTLGRGGQIGTYHVSHGRVYWFATVNAPEGTRDASSGRKREVLDHFKGWHEPIEALIEATEESAILRNDMLDREAVKQWGLGRVTLLGDAAHPTTPAMGQGAGQAIEDAAVLAKDLALTKRLSDNHSIPAGLRAYESHRMGRTAQITRVSARLGGTYQWENAFARRMRDRLLKVMFSQRLRPLMEKNLAYEV